MFTEPGNWPSSPYSGVISRFIQAMSSGQATQAALTSVILGQFLMTGLDANHDGQLDF